MYGCAILFSPEVAEQVRAEIRKHVGSYPCDEGHPCPLLPDDVTELLTPERTRLRRVE